MITGNLIRGARGLLGWSAKTLADRAHIGTATVLRIERASDIPHCYWQTIEKIQQALLGGGVRFIVEDDIGAGVQFTTRNAQLHKSESASPGGRRVEKQPSRPFRNQQ
ncbi:MAG: helix-turn-helix domain-containing protein [Rhizomicrobium sp.]